VDEEAAQRTFVGYHGTSILSVPSLLRGVALSAGGAFSGRGQLGIGFYTTSDFPTAVEFAEAAIEPAGGEPAVVEVYARDFARLIGQEVESPLWWGIPDDSSLITDFDYLTAPIAGYAPARQVKFNPRAYRALTVEMPS
jgi:hypothetical protein